MRLFGMLCVLLHTGLASGYTLVTSVSESCHERMTFEAINFYLNQVQSSVEPNFKVPDDRITRQLMALVRPMVPAARTDHELFIALSVLVGVRAPDTEGHSTLNLAALRRLHADPAPIGQYAHALRGPDDDGLEGDLIAVEGTKAVIRDELAQSLQIFQDAQSRPEALIASRAFFIEHYDTVQVPVSLSGYHLGRAIHALQDAHAHMVRSGERYEHIVHVTNYVDAVNGTLKVERDGRAHSNALDDCNRADVEPIAALARARSVAVARALTDAALMGDADAIERGLSPCTDSATDPMQCGWIEYEPVCKAAIEAGDTAAQAEVCCTAANDFCSATVPAAAIVKLDPAGPYLGCSSIPGANDGWSGWWLLALVGVRRRWMGLVLSLPGLAVAAEPSPAADPSPAAGPSPIIDYIKPAPDWFVSFEGHGAAINDTPNASFLDVEFGYTIRFGRQIDRWRITAIVDRSLWVPLEFGSRVDPGTLNLGVGGEVLLFDGFVRVGMGGGVAILLFDTLFDSAGETGVFSGEPAGGTSVEAVG